MANEPISDEDKALIRYMAESGVPNRVTCTVNHTTSTGAGYPSYHRLAGTNGLGLAVDFAGPSAGRDTPELGAIFHELDKQATRLHELIYAGPQTAYNIKDGKRVAKYASADHHDHVHVSVRHGVFLVPPPHPEVPPVMDITLPGPISAEVWLDGPIHVQFTAEGHGYWWHAPGIPDTTPDIPGPFGQPWWGSRKVQRAELSQLPGKRVAVFATNGDGPYDLG